MGLSLPRDINESRRYEKCPRTGGTNLSRSPKSHPPPSHSPPPDHRALSFSASSGATHHDGFRPSYYCTTPFDWRGDLSQLEAFLLKYSVGRAARTRDIGPGFPVLSQFNDPGGGCTTRRGCRYFQVTDVSSDPHCARRDRKRASAALGMGSAQFRAPGERAGNGNPIAHNESQHRWPRTASCTDIFFLLICLTLMLHLSCH